MASELAASAGRVADKTGTEGDTQPERQQLSGHFRLWSVVELSEIARREGFLL